MIQHLYIQSKCINNADKKSCLLLLELVSWSWTFDRFWVMNTEPLWQLLSQPVKHWMCNWFLITPDPYQMEWKLSWKDLYHLESRWHKLNICLTTGKSCAHSTIVGWTISVPISLEWPETQIASWMKFKNHFICATLLVLGVCCERMTGQLMQAAFKIKHITCRYL